MASFAGDSPLEESQARERKERYVAFIGLLRAREPAFAAASAKHSPEHAAWQAAVYLLTGCRPVWRVLGGPVLRAGSLAPVSQALARGNPRAGGSEQAVMAWAAHLWDVQRKAPCFPVEFGEFYFRRWVTALHVRHRTSPPQAGLGQREAR